MYEEGGCFIVTSRITIHDILKGIVNANDISGFLVFDAHEVHETSLEAFIIRVFKAANPDGFIKVNVLIDSNLFYYAIYTGI